MDNTIRVMFNNSTHSEPVKTGIPELLKTGLLGASDVIDDGPSKSQGGLSVRIKVSQNSEKDHDLNEVVFKDEKKVKERTLLVYCESKAKTFLSDLKNVVLPKFGIVQSAKWQSLKDDDGPKIISVVLYSSELDAVRCISETNKGLIL